MGSPYYPEGSDNKNAPWNQPEAREWIKADEDQCESCGRHRDVDENYTCEKCFENEEFDPDFYVDDDSWIDE